MSGWRYAVRSGLRDTIRARWRAAMLGAYVSLLAFILGTATGLVEQSIQDISATQRLVEQNASYFVAGEIPPTSTEKSDSALRAAVLTALDSGEAYSVVVRSGEDVGAAFVAYAYGDFAETLGITLPDRPPPYVLVGSQISVPVDSKLTIDGSAYPVSGVIRDGGFVDQIGRAHV